MRSLDDLPPDVRRDAVNDRAAIWLFATFLILFAIGWGFGTVSVFPALWLRVSIVLTTPVIGTGFVSLIYRWAYERWPW